MVVEGGSHDNSSRRAGRRAQGFGAYVSPAQEVSLGAPRSYSPTLSFPAACPRVSSPPGRLDGGIGGNDNRDRMLQIRYCFTLRLHSAFRISIVSPCLCLSVCLYRLFFVAVVVARFFVAPFVLVALKRLLQFEQLAD